MQDNISYISTDFHKSTNPQITCKHKTFHLKKQHLIQ